MTDTRSSNTCPDADKDLGHGSVGSTPVGSSTDADVATKRGPPPSLLTEAEASFALEAQRARETAAAGVHHPGSLLSLSVRARCMCMHACM